MQLCQRAKMLKTIDDPLQFLQRLLDGLFVFIHRARVQERKFEHSLEYSKWLCRFV